MRSIRLLAATTVILSAAWACGGDGGGVGPNLDPVANFTVGTCTAGVACTFTDSSTDPDGTITSRRWLFGDGSAEVTDPGLTPSHTYTTAGSYNVTLTVTDNGGKTNAKQAAVVVNTGTPNNVPPTASFTAPACFVATPCAFHSSSTDTDGQIVSSEWNFGDNTTGSGVDVTHTYNASGTFTVTLTVADEDGATAPTSQTVTVQAPQTVQCEASGTRTVDCNLDVTQRATVKITLTSRDCEIGGNKVSISQPVSARQTLFFNGCSEPTGGEYPILNSAGAPMVFEAGTQIQVRFTQGLLDAGDPPANPPAATLEGTYPNWTISIDDGGNRDAPGEPDFTDVVLAVQATPAP